MLLGVNVISKIFFEFFLKIHDVIDYLPDILGINIKDEKSIENQNLSTIKHENDMNTKLSSSNPSLKSSTGNLLNELSFTNEKVENGKKMNVFERLFRGHKKKV